MVTAGVTLGVTVTSVAVEVAEQSAALVTVTVYEPTVLTVIDCVVAPLLHNQDAPADAVSVTEPPLQNVTGPPAVIVAVGNVFTVITVAAEVAEHPAALVTVTVYEPAVLTVIACVVAPLLHNQDVPADAVSVTEPPVQNATGPPAVIVAVGNGFIVTVTWSVAVGVVMQVALLVIVTDTTSPLLSVEEE
jgi:hypothetical protein